METPRFDIDFIEFAFLVEACIPPMPIARTMFWQKVIDSYYHVLTPEERLRLYEWIGKTYRYRFGLADENKDCWLFEHRFNPDNQYRVTTYFEGKTKVDECFKMGERYHTTASKSIQEQYITLIEKV
jgi:hypothetical protein